METKQFFGFSSSQKRAPFQKFNGDDTLDSFYAAKTNINQNPEQTKNTHTRMRYNNNNKTNNYVRCNALDHFSHFLFGDCVIYFAHATFNIILYTEHSTKTPKVAYYFKNSFL